MKTETRPEQYECIIAPHPEGLYEISGRPYHAAWSFPTSDAPGAAIRRLHAAHDMTIEGLEQGREMHKRTNRFPKQIRVSLTEDETRIIVIN
jgi:hypothetical protein